MMTLKIVVLLALLAAVIAGTIEGPNYLTNIGSAEDGKSFYVDPQQSDVKWTNALDFCHEHLLNLARIESLEQNAIVLSYANGTSSFWIAISDLGSEGEFRSLKDSRAVPYNHFVGNNTRSSNCAAVIANGNWEYVSCSFGRHKPLCE